MSGRRYGIVHASWFGADPRVDAKAIAVLSALATYADRSGWCRNVTQSVLANITRLSRDTVNTTIAVLVDAGLLEKQSVTSRGRTRACQYRIVGHEDVCAEKPDHARKGEAGQSEVGCADTSSQHSVDETDSDSPNPKNKSLSAHSRETKNGVLQQPVERIPATDVQARPWQPTAEDLAHAAVERPDLNAVDLKCMTRKLLAHYGEQPPGNLSAIWRRWLVTERAGSPPRGQRQAKSLPMSEVPATTGNAAPAAPTPLSPAEWRAQLEAQAEERRARVRAAEKEREAEQARRYAAANPAAAPDVQDRRRQERQESARRVAESLAERRRLLAELSGAGEACAETAVVETVGDYVETLVVAPVSHPDVQAPKAATQRAPAIPVVVPATRTWRPLAIVHPSRAQRASPSFPDALGMARPERTAHAAHSG